MSYLITYLLPFTTIVLLSSSNMFAMEGNSSPEDIYNELSGQFITIPAGKLPGENFLALAAMNQNMIAALSKNPLYANIFTNETPKNIESFEITAYPITRRQWQSVMGILPTGLQEALNPQVNNNYGERSNYLKQSIDPHFNCPVTHVSWDNGDSSSDIKIFLQKLNEVARLKGDKCTFEVPNNDQVTYSIRADTEGLNIDLYSVGINDDNLEEYMEVSIINPTNPYLYNKRSNIQEIGFKKKNAFGIQLGIVWRLSVTPGATTKLSAHGGSYMYGKKEAQSSSKRNFQDGNSSTGFSIVRICQNPQ